MEKLSFVLNHAQKDALDGLAYRIADNYYMIERYGKTEAAFELAENHKTICGLFDKLDKLAVPFWLQNAVIFWAENWRAYKSEYMETGLKKAGYNVTFAEA